ncbi:MAG TPA: hypothetical protein VJO72_17180, partial [Candidatus Dormibacteraeota bacterium]|nr:hypothetical protein [Candidatus Dormibacteraeota bacterium]
KRACRGYAIALVAFLPEIGPHGEQISSISCLSAPRCHRAGCTLDRASRSTAGIKRTSGRGRDPLDIGLAIQHFDRDAQNDGQRLDQAEGARGERFTDAIGKRRLDEPNSRSGANAHADANANTHTYPHANANTNTHTYPHAHADASADAHTCPSDRVRDTKWQPATPERPELPLRRTEHL